MTRYLDDQQLVALETQYTRSGMRQALVGFFGANAIEHELGSDTISCRFDATAPDESKEVRWVTISTANTPEMNMNILHEARRQQHMYQTTRHEIPGIDVPQQPAEEKAAKPPGLPVPAKVS